MRIVKMFMFHSFIFTENWKLKIIIYKTFQQFF